MSCACVLGLGRYQEWLDLLLQVLRVEAEETWRRARYGTPRLKTQLLHRSRCLMEEMAWRLHRANVVEIAAEAPVCPKGDGSGINCIKA